MKTETEIRERLNEYNSKLDVLLGKKLEDINMGEIEAFEKLKAKMQELNWILD